jgi:hypothetical protein
MKPSTQLIITLFQEGEVVYVNAHRNRRFQTIVNDDGFVFIYLFDSDDACPDMEWEITPSMIDNCNVSFIPSGLDHVRALFEFDTLEVGVKQQLSHPTT